jgi:hypothetical protein
VRDFAFLPGWRESWAAHMKQQQSASSSDEIAVRVGRVCKVPEGRRFTLEIIHDMAGSDCSAYANDFRTVFNPIVGLVNKPISGP